MAYTSYKIISAEPDTTPAPGVGVGGLNAQQALRPRANQNVIVIAEFSGDSGETAFRAHTFGVNLTLAAIDRWALAKIAAANAQLASLSELQAEIDSVKVPEPADSKLAAAIEKQRDAKAAIARAQIVALNDPDALAKYDDAVAAVTDAAAVVAISPAIVASPDVIAKP